MIHKMSMSIHALSPKLLPGGQTPTRGLTPPEVVYQKRRGLTPPEVVYQILKPPVQSLLTSSTFMVLLRYNNPQKQ